MNTTVVAYMKSGAWPWINFGAYHWYKWYLILITFFNVYKLRFNTVFVILNFFMMFYIIIIFLHWNSWYDIIDIAMI